jgi:general stress protein 26
MGDVKNLMNNEAIETLRQIAQDADIALFSTNLEKIPLSTRPMSTQQVDDEGNLWFMSRRGSNKNMAIEQDSRVQLFYSNMSSSEYLHVFGYAEISYDQNKIEDFLSPITKAWFTEGKDDSSINLIKVAPAEIYYWDTKSGKVVSLFQIAVSALTGKEMDGGVEGKLTV